MSGMGSSGGFGSGGAGGGNFDCADFCFETHIHSPNPNTISSLNVGDILYVVLATINGVDVVQVQNANGVGVGGLVDRGPRIRQCLELGFRFTATVRGISGAAVRIFVQSQGR